MAGGRCSGRASRSHSASPRGSATTRTRSPDAGRSPKTSLIAPPTSASPTAESSPNADMWTALPARALQAAPSRARLPDMEPDADGARRPQADHQDLIKRTHLLPTACPLSASMVASILWRTHGVARTYRRPLTSPTGASAPDRSTRVIRFAGPRAKAIGHPGRPHQPTTASNSDQRRTRLTGEVVMPISWVEPVEHRVHRRSCLPGTRREASDDG